MKKGTVITYLISFVLIGVGVACLIYPTLPQELLAQFPKIELPTLLSVGGSSGALGGGALALGSFITKEKTTIVEDNLQVRKEIINMKKREEERDKAYAQRLQQQDELIKTLTKEQRRANRLIETDLLIKKDNRYMRPEAKKLIDDTVQGD